LKLQGENMKEGYIKDYISGAEVKDTPEESVVQLFVQQLVEDYHYPKASIQTRPQYRVKIRPSDTKREFPIDIAVFSDSQKTDENLHIVVECKKKNRKDGKTQLQDYLRFCKARIGVWFNGDEKLYIKKIEKDGKIFFEEIPNIPNFGQRLEDVGLFKRRDLQIPHNLKLVFKTIRNHLAGNLVGTTRDEELARELINVIFCKIYDEKFTKPNDILEFRAGLDEDKNAVKQRIEKLFEKVKAKYNAVIDVGEKINLAAGPLYYVVGELQKYCLIESHRDVIAEAFETFIGYALKGAQGQFFTPRNVVRLMVKILNPNHEKLIIDPACGSGGFLVESLKYIWDRLEIEAKEYGWNEGALNEERVAVAINNIRGIEKDNFLSKVTKAYMAIIGDGKGGIFCEDSLEVPSEWSAKTQQAIQLGTFDFVLTNPPFGKNMKVTGEEKLSQYTLAHKWKKNEGVFERIETLETEKAPQIIFIERAMQLLNEGGALGIVLPETFFHAPNSKYILQYICTGNNVQWIVDLPHNTFRPHNNAKCLVLMVQKGVKQQENVNMAVAEEMGHNHQGKEIYRWDYINNRVNSAELWDDIELIEKEIDSGFKKYCFTVPFSACASSGVFVPRYFWNSKHDEITQIVNKTSSKLVSIQKLMDEKILTVFDGHGSPEAENKGMGDYPYIRVKDIVNWDLYKDPTAKVPENVYKKFYDEKKQLKPRDIIFVKRGSYRIGSVAMASQYDSECILTKELLVFRLLKNENTYNLNPYYLLYLLSSKIVSMQIANKVLIETTLPNIGDRWKELELPISNDAKEIEKITSKVKKVIDNKWDALSGIDSLIKEIGAITT